MGEKKQFRGCKCGCGTGTWGMYAPGHDARHVKQQVGFVTALWGKGAEAEVMWERAIKNLPTEALRSKFRRQMMNQAARHLAPIVTEMQSPEWARQMRVDLMVQAVDPAFVGSNFRSTIEAAAAMGMSRRSINQRRS